VRGGGRRGRRAGVAAGRRALAVSATLPARPRGAAHERRANTLAAVTPAARQHNGVASAACRGRNSPMLIAATAAQHWRLKRPRRHAHTPHSCRCAVARGGVLCAPWGSKQHYACQQCAELWGLRPALTSQRAVLQHLRNAANTHAHTHTHTHTRAHVQTHARTSSPAPGASAAALSSLSAPSNSVLGARSAGNSIFC
jgi:septal ring-binding cell division protein DamX